jgi:hypothetical protein
MDLGINRRHGAGTSCENLRRHLSAVAESDYPVPGGSLTIKETAGKSVGNPSLQAKGNIEKNLGKVQAKVGEVTEDLKKSSK